MHRNPVEIKKSKTKIRQKSWFPCAQPLTISTRVTFYNTYKTDNVEVTSIIPEENRKASQHSSPHGNDISGLPMGKNSQNKQFSSKKINEKK